VAPLTMLVLVPRVGTSGALILAGLVGPLVAVPLICARTVEGDVLARRVEAARGDLPKADRTGTVFTPAILGLMVFFILLSLSTSGITNFSVPALMGAYHLPFSAANLALTAYLTASAFGVLGGGFVADMTRRHGEVAAMGFGVNAVLVLLIGTIGLGPALLVLVMGLAGFLSGMIMPSRDMLVRAAAPAGAIGRAFGIVTIGFSIGGTIGPVLFGWIMDRGMPHWIFGSSAIFMLLTVAAALIGDRRSTGRRAAMVRSTGSA
jgi:MFS family permease